MGLFSKGCVICDGKCGLTSSKSIADGKLCENCISELSPWFTDFKHATAESVLVKQNCNTPYTFKTP